MGDPQEMITIDNVRTFDDDRKPSHGAPKQVDTERALYYMLNCELRFGAEIVTLEPTEIVLKTTVLGCIDIVTFTGGPDEMSALCKVCSYVTLIYNESYKGELTTTISQMASKFNNNLAITKVAANLNMGHNVICRALVAGLCEQNLDKADVFAGIDYSELLNLFIWHVVDGESFETIHSMVA